MGTAVSSNGVSVAFLRHHIVVVYCELDLLVLMRFVLHRHDGLVAQGLEEIPPFLTRSAFAGSQRYGAILWSGDIESTFDELAVQVQVAQHVAMSGIYWWCVIADSLDRKSVV